MVTTKNMSKINPILSSIKIKVKLKKMELNKISSRTERRWLVHGGLFDPKPTRKILVLSINLCENVKVKF